MSNVCDVAEYVLAKVGSMSAMKLQKLVYYSQAWHCAWTDRTLFDEPIQAWANGPVVPALYQAHKGQFILKPGVFGGNPNALSDEERDTVDRVLDAYADKSPQWLSDLTHMESPWKHARAGVSDGERSSREITPAMLIEYYSNL